MNRAALRLMGLHLTIGIAAGAECLAQGVTGATATLRECLRHAANEAARELEALHRKSCSCANCAAARGGISGRAN